jgi:hypothetical protein
MRMGVHKIGKKKAHVGLTHKLQLGHTNKDKRYVERADGAVVLGVWRVCIVVRRMFM